MSPLGGMIMTTPVLSTEEMMKRSVMASAVFSQLDQKQVDEIVQAVYEAGFNQRVRLAKMAVEETGIGIWQHKVLKNVVATQLVYENIRNERTVGIIAENEERGIVEIAHPMGPILAIIPVTNPTSTVMFKILIALKTRNPIIICPSKKAIKCCAEAAKICYEAALQCGAPEDCVQWITQVSRENTQALMKHPRLSLILATGGTGLVREAYSSGTPALGVGAGNVPVYIEQTADIPFAAQQLLMSKTFDNGTICASEQALVVEAPVAAQMREELIRNHAVFLSQEEIERLEAVAWLADKKLMNPDVVGQSAVAIAERAGLKVPSDTVLLITPLKGVGEAYPLSGEVLAPILAWYEADDFDTAVKICMDLNYHGGIGHSASMFSNDEARIKKFAAMMNAGRVVINTPSSQGAVGGIFNMLAPSLTLGCGTGGKNITTENVTARHLLNIQRIARRRDNRRFFGFSRERYLDETLDAKTAWKEYNKNY